jgi:hypothetical protein
VLCDLRPFGVYGVAGLQQRRSIYFVFFAIPAYYWFLAIVNIFSNFEDFYRN